MTRIVVIIVFLEGPHWDPAPRVETTRKAPDICTVGPTCGT